MYFLTFSELLLLGSQSILIPVPHPGSLTYICHLRHRGAVGAFIKERRVVIDVLNPNYELRRGLQGAVCLPVGGRGDETVLVLLLTVQRLGDVDVARLLVDHKDRSRPLASQDVLCASIIPVHVRVELDERGRERGGGEGGGEESKQQLEIKFTFTRHGNEDKTK